MSRTARTIALVVVVLVGVLVAVFGVSAGFASGTAAEDKVLEATSGGGMGLLAIALALIAFGTPTPAARTAWAALWVLPLFLALHVALLGTWIPDAVLSVITATALVVGRPVGVGARLAPAITSPVG